jgi:hypothetical protein
MFKFKEGDAVKIANLNRHIGDPGIVEEMEENLNDGAVLIVAYCEATSYSNRYECEDINGETWTYAESWLRLAVLNGFDIGGEKYV